MSTSSFDKDAAFYSSPTGRVNQASVVHACARLNLELIERWGNGGSALFLGLGEGGLLELLGSRFSRAVAVEASATLVAATAQRFAHLTSLSVVQDLFETYDMPPSQQVECLLGNHVLEHLDEPVAMLRRSHRWLTQQGLAVFTVPNANSLHRRIGVAMGLLNRVDELSPQDKVVGHKRIYDLERLQRDVVEGGYEILETGGFNVKLVSQQQMLDWSPELHQAIYEVSRSCPPDLCSNIYVAGRPCRS